MSMAKQKEQEDPNPERDDWLAFSDWAFDVEAWHIATRYADLLGLHGARALCQALRRAEGASTGREALRLNEARVMVLGAIERRYS